MHVELSSTSSYSVGSSNQVRSVSYGLLLENNVNYSVNQDYALNYGIVSKAPHNRFDGEVVIGSSSDLVAGANTRNLYVAGDAIVTGEMEVSGDIDLNGNIVGDNSSTITGIASITAGTIDTGQGANELYDMDQNVKTTSAVTFATVDTGQGANELYDMNQNVTTTSSPTFNNINTTGQHITSAPIGFSAVLTSAQSIAHNSFTLVNWNSDSGADYKYDLGSDFSTSLEKFTAPVDGLYYFKVGLIWASATWTSGENYIIGFMRDSATSPAYHRVYNTVDASVTDIRGMHTSGLMNLDANDQVGVMVFQNSGGSISLYGAQADSLYNQFTGHLVQAR